MEEHSFCHLSELDVVEGEEHMADMLAPEAGGRGAHQGTDNRVPGRLRGKHEEYEKIGAEPYVVCTIREGYRLEFDGCEPPPSFLPNNRSAREAPEFVASELERLEALGCIEKVKERPRVVNPMSVVMSGKLRLVLDGSRNLNPYCKQRGIKLEDHSHISSTVKRGDFMVVNDHDSGYWHVPVAEDHWTFLGIHIVDEGGQIHYWVWKVLVLGLRDAAHIYTRINRPIMAALRREGKRGLIYIDDVLTAAESLKKCLEAEARMYELFEACGWVFKPSKRSGDPSQSCRFLGLIIDSRDYTFNIPEEKINNIKAVIDQVRKEGRKVKVKLVARLIGKLQAVRLATGPIVAVLTRSLTHVVVSAPTWRSKVELTEMAWFELNWWDSNLSQVSKFPIREGLSSTPVSYETASDASGVGHFSYLVGGSSTTLASRAFTEEEQLQSSTWRELLSVHETWTRPEVLARFEGSRVAHYTDNKAVAAILHAGSRNTRLQPMVVEVVLALRGARIVMEAVWRSREEGVIQWADRGSRDFHKDDVSLDFESMAKIFEEFGCFQVDTFASASNTKGARFFSRLDVPHTAGVNFFHQKLNVADSHFCFPPPILLVSALQHFER